MFHRFFVIGWKFNHTCIFWCDQYWVYKCYLQCRALIFLLIFYFTHKILALCVFVLCLSFVSSFCLLPNHNFLQLLNFTVYRTRSGSNEKAKVVTHFLSSLWQTIMQLHLQIISFIKQCENHQLQILYGRGGSFKGH